LVKVALNSITLTLTPSQLLGRIQPTTSTFLSSSHMMTCTSANWTTCHYQLILLIRQFTSSNPDIMWIAGSAILIGNDMLFNLH
jgi:hypothetical protein